ncbi:hypothetical protein LZC95_19965 [Pendulispora brunnea]|uniref:Uncharacterized protein n=1 Tax=Pendulispora brunnea TaxID=2905690 RepID=A0ABZ2KKL7_9BACT
MKKARAVVDLKKLPTEVEEMAKLDVDFPRLPEDSPKGCPWSMADIRRYLRAECCGGTHDLFFGRTAVIGNVRFWLWGYVEGGRTYFVEVADRGGGDAVLGMGGEQGLTPEQYMALYYARWCRKPQWRPRVL